MSKILQNSNSFFRAMGENEVRYMLVGGWAVNYYGYSRVTGDIDIWIEDVKVNRANFISALKSMDIDGAELFAVLPFIAGYTEILLDNGIYVDLMADLLFSKQKEFNLCYQNATMYPLEDDVIIPIINLQKLIEEKSQSHRLKDKSDAIELKKISEKHQ